MPLDNFRVDFDKDCEDPEYKPLQGPPKDQDDEVRDSHLSLAFLCYWIVKYPPIPWILKYID